MTDFLTKKQVKVGERVPDFTLPGMDGKAYGLSDFNGKILVLDFWSAECPASARYDSFFGDIQKSYGPRGVVFLAIDANAIYDDAEILRVMKERSIPFPVLRDKGNAVADLFGAICTPHVFVLDREQILRYEGAIDDQSWENKTPRVNHLKDALEALLEGKTIPKEQVQPFGCSVKRSW